MKTNDLETIKELKDRGLSLLALNESYRYESTETGIKPILIGLNKDLNFFMGMSVYDKIIGKAAAMLFVFSKVKSVYGVVMSKAAVEILEKYGIEYKYEILTDRIINRKGDDICPMEKTVEGVEDIKEAYMKLLERSKELNG